MYIRNAMEDLVSLIFLIANMALSLLVVGALEMGVTSPQGECSLIRSAVDEI